MIKILRTSDGKILRTALGKILRYEIPDYTSIKYGLLYNWYATQTRANVEYGFLYNWYAATSVNKITSSDDWIVPNITMYQDMKNYLGGEINFQDKVKENNINYWNNITGVTNSAMFNGRGGGWRKANGDFTGLKTNGFYCCLYGTDTYSQMELISGAHDFSITISIDNAIGTSIRLLYTGVGTPTEYVGNDGSIYPIIQIGSQYWMASNLMETKYRNGSFIPEVTDSATWAGLSTGARCSYNNAQTNAGSGTAITSSDDWVVPTKTQYDSLTTYLGGSGSANAGGKLKETGTTYWDSPNTGATNIVEFNGRGSGYRTTIGSFSSIKGVLYAHVTTDTGDPNYLFLMRLDSSGNYGNCALWIETKKLGASIRLLYTGVGTPTEYVGNDLKRYRVVTINGVTYTADNLAETKYRDGSTIPEVTDNTTWAGLTSGARCYYNNDSSNL